MTKPFFIAALSPTWVLSRILNICLHSSKSISKEIYFRYLNVPKNCKKLKVSKNMHFLKKKKNGIFSCVNKVCSICMSQTLSCNLNINYSDGNTAKKTEYIIQYTIFETFWNWQNLLDLFWLRFCWSLELLVFT